MTDLGIPGVGDATMIAAGGSALVYEALSGTGERLAVKVLRGIRGTEITRRFEREQSAAERLGDHPNIIQIHHSGLTAVGEPYLVMPLLAQGSLNDELERRGAFPLQQAVNDVAIAAEALEFAHGRGVLHRDIKPANLLRDDNGSVIVTDFGIARVVDAGISSATVGATTPLYAAPELLAENAASVQSEVYALGALLYALLAGQAAFSDTGNIWATMHRIRADEPPVIAHVPPTIMQVIHQAMAKAPHDRPATALAFRDLLLGAYAAVGDWQPPAAPPEIATTTQIPDDLVVLGPSMSSPPATDLPPVRYVSEPAPAPPAAVPTVIAPGRPTPTQTADLPASRRPNLAPPAPNLRRPAPAVGPAPARDSSVPKVLAAAAVLALVAGLAWWGTTRLFEGNLDDQAAIAPPVDNSLPSLSSDAEPGTAASTDDDPSTNGVTVEELPTSPELPDRFVSFNGDFFSAYLPEGWSLLSRDVDEGYGFRSKFVSADMYLNVDTTPKEQREPGADIAQGARDIAAGISSASEVRTEEVDGLVMHSFTFRNRQGVDSIDIFFEVDGDGYAVVAGSASDPDTAFATARLVALTIRSNPDQ